MATRGPGGKPLRESGLGFVMAPGTPLGTVGIRLDADGNVLGSARSDAIGGPSLDHRQPLTDAQTAVLTQAVRKAAAQSRPDPVDLELPELGGYRVLTAPRGACSSASRSTTSTPPCAP